MTLFVRWIQILLSNVHSLVASTSSIFWNLEGIRRKVRSWAWIFQWLKYVVEIPTLKRTFILYLIIHRIFHQCCLFVLFGSELHFTNIGWNVFAVAFEYFSFHFKTLRHRVFVGITPTKFISTVCVLASAIEHWISV